MSENFVKIIIRTPTSNFVVKICGIRKYCGQWFDVEDDSHKTVSVLSEIYLLIRAFLNFSHPREAFP